MRPAAKHLVLHGHSVVEAGPNAHGALAFEATIGAGRMALRPPQAMRALFDKLATNQPVPLSDAEVLQAEEMGVKLADATSIVRDRAIADAAAKGISVIGSPDAHYKPLQPVRVTKSFTPAPTSY